MLTPQDRQEVQAMIQATKANEQFSLNRMPFHTHNGKDSPFIYLPTVAYAGYIQGDGTLSRTAPFPSGWNLSHPGNGQYGIQHNLGSTFYVVTATAIGVSANARPMVPRVTSRGANDFTITWYAPGMLTATAAISGASCTLSSNWQGTTGSYLIMFSDNESKVVTLTNGATTCTWSGNLTNTCDPAMSVSLETTFQFVLTHVSNTKAGWPLYNKNAT